MSSSDEVYQEQADGQSSLVRVNDSTTLQDAPRRCTGHKTNGQDCPNFAVRGDVNQKCHAHGGLAPGRPVTTALHTKFLPERLRQRYEELVNAPDYVSLREQIGTINLRIQELWQRLGRRDSSKRRADIVESMDDLVKAVNANLMPPDLMVKLEDFDPENPESVEQAVVAARIVLRGARVVRNHVLDLQDQAKTDRREDECWDDMDRFSESLRKLKETEVKRMVAANQVLTVTESYNLIQRLVQFIETHLEDSGLRAKAIRELYTLLDRKGSK